MSTSYSPAFEAEAEAQPEIRPFPYAEAAHTAGDGGVRAGAESADEMALAAQQEKKRLDDAREEGRRDGEARARAVFEEQLLRARDSVRLALDSFSRERMAYYQQVESEVVQLALSIARKILHREAQVDPLLLAGMVRVALDQIESNTRVVVRVHPQSAAECREFFARSMDTHDVPEVVEDASLEPDRCVLQTELGTTELGIDVQLKEIEQGLLDLLAHRPTVGA